MINVITGSEVKEEQILNIKPKKFIVWLFVVSSIMFFGGWTSAYIVSRGSMMGENTWISFELPPIFILSTVLIVLSSLTLHWAFTSAKRLRFAQQKLALSLTLLLGTGFLVCQVLAWNKLVDMNMFLAGHTSGSYIYLISGFHGLHIVAGICILLICLIGLFRNVAQVRNIFRMEIASIFWHFIDILWIYLYVFLLLNR